MTQFVQMRTTDPPSSASRTAAGGRLCHAPEFRLAPRGATNGEAQEGPSGVPNVLIRYRIGIPVRVSDSDSIGQIPISL